VKNELPIFPDFVIRKSQKVGRVTWFVWIT